MKSKERGVMKWLTRMNKCIVGKQYKKGGRRRRKRNLAPNTIGYQMCERIHKIR
jgi:hypothetical protein